MARGEGSPAAGDKQFVIRAAVRGVLLAAWGVCVRGRGEELPAVREGRQDRGGVQRRRGRSARGCAGHQAACWPPAPPPSPPWARAASPRCVPQGLMVPLHMNQKPPSWQRGLGWRKCACVCVCDCVPVCCVGGGGTGAARRPGKGRAQPQRAPAGAPPPAGQAHRGRVDRARVDDAQVPRGVGRREF